jgi:hypothetical protein
MATSPGARSSLLAQCISEAASDGAELMDNLVIKARQGLMFRIEQAFDSNERRGHDDGLRLLDQQHTALRERFAKQLRTQFDVELVEKKAKPLSALSFGQLELMDEAQVLEKVEIARAQQLALSSAEAELNELNGLISTVLGFGSIQADRNPLRPEVYLRALRETLAMTPLSASQRLTWMQSMASALGKELAGIYRVISTRLKAQGITPAGYAVIQTPAGGSGGGGGTGGYRGPSGSGGPFGSAGSGGPSIRGGGEGPLPVSRSFNPRTPGFSTPGAVDGAAEAAAFAMGGSGAAPLGPADRARTLLTVDQLRRLLTGEFDRRAPTATMAAAAREADGSFHYPTASNERPDFANTVPAAFEALEEMRQVEQVMHRFAQRQLVAQRAGARVVPGTDGVATLKAMAIGNEQKLIMAGDQLQLGQALGLEVVTLMMESIGRDPRLLPALRDTLRALEQALMRLAMVDPRFFSDRRHPARRLLEEITQRGLGFTQADDPAFQAFTQPIWVLFEQLNEQPIHGAEPFQWVMDTLTRLWADNERGQLAARGEVARALAEVERKQSVASAVARAFRKRPDVAAAPAALVDFICGPWSQVVARARLEDPGGEAGPHGYEALVSELVWSVNPEAVRGQGERLVQLIPSLLGQMRAGLKSISFPPEKTTVLLDLLMAYHHQTLKASSAEVASSAAAPLPTTTDSKRAALEAELSRVARKASWMASEEAARSNLMDLSDTGGLPKGLANDAVSTAPDALSAVEELVELSNDIEGTGPAPLTPGSWVEFYQEGQWTRAQLAWASPQGTMFLFQGQGGRTHSMTRRLVEKLLREGVIIEVADQGVVEGALDAVADAAMRNSVDLLI